MGYRGKQEEQARARELRLQSWTLADIAAELDVSKSSVSLWVRDVNFEPQPRRTARRRGPNKLQRRKAAEIEAGRVEGRSRFGMMDEQAFLAAGVALYAGEGSKTGNEVCFAKRMLEWLIYFVNGCAISSTSTSRDFEFAYICTKG